MKLRRSKKKNRKKNRGLSNPVRFKSLIAFFSFLPAVAIVWLVGAHLLAPVVRSSDHAVTSPLGVDSTIRKIDTAVHLASTYLARQLKKDGRFIYRVNLDPGVRLSRRYNILRHEGTIYALGMYHQRFPKAETATVISQASDFLRTQIAPLPKFPDVMAIWSDPEVNNYSEFQVAKLGGTGLGLVALLSEEAIHSGATGSEILGKLGKFLLYMQRPDGSFYSTKARGQAC